MEVWRQASNHYFYSWFFSIGCCVLFCNVALQLSRRVISALYLDRRPWPEDVPWLMPCRWSPAYRWDRWTGLAGRHNPGREGDLRRTELSGCQASALLDRLDTLGPGARLAWRSADQDCVWGRTPGPGCRGMKSPPGAWREERPAVPPAVTCFHGFLESTEDTEYKARCSKLDDKRRIIQQGTHWRIFKTFSLGIVKGKLLYLCEYIF